jgi:tetratricopeptide (TPR) repeat protein
MTRVLPVLCAATAIAGLGTAYVMLGAGATERIDVPKSLPTPPAPTANAMEARLAVARRTCDVAAVDPVVANLREAIKTSSDDHATWHLLALAHLERALLRSHDRGMVVGTPVFDQQPRELLDDLDAGLAAARRARELGDDSSDLFRIEAGLMSQRIVDLKSALQWNGKVQDALQAAGQRQVDNPHLHVALGLRKLLAPKWLGHDAAKALEHFEFAATAIADDERPEVFAARAAFLQKKRLQAITWLEQAVAQNPANRFARVALARLRAGEDDPFGRHVTAAEAAATK